MTTQPEAELEAALIAQLQSMKYARVKIKGYLLTHLSWVWAELSSHCDRYLNHVYLKKGLDSPSGFLYRNIKEYCISGET